MHWIAFALGAALSWGMYGPALHGGQVKLGSPFRALLCVGIAYMLVGVLVPVVALSAQGELGKGWSTRGVTIGDLNADGRPDLVVGAPNAEPSSACTNMGAAYVFLGQENGGWERLRLNPTEYNGSFNAYGWSVAFGTVDGRRLLLVGEQGADVSGVDNAGQVYVYRVDTP